MPDSELSDPISTLQRLVARKIHTETAMEWATKELSPVQNLHLSIELQDIDQAILAIRAVYRTPL